MTDLTTALLGLAAITALAFATALHATRALRRRDTAPAPLAGDDTGAHHADQVDEAGDRPGRYRGIHRPGANQPGRHETGWPTSNLITDTAEIDLDVLRRLVDGDATTEVTP